MSQPFDHAQYGALAGGRREIDRDAALVAVERDERRADPCVLVQHLLGDAEVARLVAAARLLHLDHVGAEVAQDLRGGRTREHARQVQDAYAG